MKESWLKILKQNADKHVAIYGHGISLYGERFSVMDKDILIHRAGHVIASIKFFAISKVLDEQGVYTIIFIKGS